ncbi:hypothetical protein C8R43DRAFT_1124702 [Mycena crocata]|nr:hypothetical protein C8R43DRAFT_1124702 [Mycena crocata]
MHRALHIAEIVDIICGHMLTDGPAPRKPRQSDLAALAQTSTTFEEPALCILWSLQETFMNIVKCLPADALEETRVEGLEVLRLSRTITPADCERPLKYARYVKSFLYYAADEGRMPSADVFDAIVRLLPQEHIFPNIRMLAWLPATSLAARPLFPYISRFLGPKLKDLSISVLSGGQISSLPSISMQCPTLRQAVVITDLEDEDAVFLQNISAFVVGLKHVEFLQVDELDRAAFDHLSQLPSLKSLTLRAQLDEELEPSTAESDDTFPALQTLVFCHVTPTRAATFLREASPLQLRELTIGAAFLVPEEDTNALFKAMAAHLSHTTLLHVCLGMKDSSSPAIPAPDIPRYALTGSTLSNLFRFVNLRTVDLRAPVGFAFDDAAAWDMARAWPRVERLKLRPTANAREMCPVRLTLHGVRAFAAHCPALRELNLSFTTRVVPELDASYIPQTSLATLGVGRSLVSSPADVARFIRGIFPELRWIEFEDRSDGGEVAQRTWLEVGALLQRASERVSQASVGSTPVPPDGDR